MNFKGYVKLHRKIEDSGLMQMPNTFTLFAFLLIKATHKPLKVGTPNGVIELERGQYISGRKKLALDLKQSEREVRTSLSRLHDLEMISSKSTNRYSIYTIENYNKYQDSDQQDDQQTTNERPADDQQTTTKQETNNLNTLETKKRTKAKKANAFDLPDWINQEHWDIWISKNSKKTNDQKQLAVNKLNRWREAGLNYKQALEDAAEGGWQGLHEPKKITNQKVTNGKSSTDSAYEKLFGNDQEKDITDEAARI